MNPPKFTYVTLIHTTVEKLWTALTSPEFTSQYWFGTNIESDWKVGSAVTYRRGDEITDEGVVLACEPPRLLSYSFHHVWTEEWRHERPSRVTFTIESLNAGSKLQGNAVRLTVVHDEFDADSKVFGAISGGWPAILSNLKTLLETGKALELSKVC